MTRPDWDPYFMALAELAATRATCDRKHVGAVLVKGRRVLATGYNGAPGGLPSCDEAGHQRVDVGGRQSCVATLHAESNALDWAGREARGSTLYTTAFPCHPCALRIVNAGIVRVCYGEHYASQNTPLAVTLLGKAGIEVVQVSPARHPLVLEAVALLVEIHQSTALDQYEDFQQQIEDFLRRAK